MLFDQEVIVLIIYWMMHIILLSSGFLGSLLLFMVDRLFGLLSTTEPIGPQPYPVIYVVANPARVAAAAVAPVDGCLGFIPPPRLRIAKGDRHMLNIILAFYEQLAMVLEAGDHPTSTINDVRTRVYKVLASLDLLRTASWSAVGLVAPAKLRVDHFSRRKGSITHTQVVEILKDLQKACAIMLKALRNAKEEGLWPSATEVIKASKEMAVSTASTIGFTKDKASIAIGVQLVLVRSPTEVVNPRAVHVKWSSAICAAD